MPNGYGPAMRIFTKVSKVSFSPFSHLRSKRLVGSCSSLSRKIDTAHNKIQHYGGLNVSDTTNSILVASLRESTRKKYNPYQ